MDAAKLRINFRRLLQRCEAMASQEDVSKHNKFKTFLEVLRKDLKKLKEWEKSGRPEQGIGLGQELAQYERRLTFLEDLLNKDKVARAVIVAELEALRESSVMEGAAATGMTPAEMTSRKEAEVLAKAHAEEEQRRELLGAAASSHSGAGLRKRVVGGLGTKLSSTVTDDVDLNDDDAAAAVLAEHRDEREAVAASMVEMAAALKSHALTANRLLAADKQTLNEVEDALGANLASTSSLNTTLKKYTDAARACTCFTWLLVLLVVMAFAGVFVVIKIAPKRI